MLEISDQTLETSPKVGKSGSPKEAATVVSMKNSLNNIDEIRKKLTRKIEASIFSPSPDFPTKN